MLLLVIVAEPHNYCRSYFIHCQVLRCVNYNDCRVVIFYVDKANFCNKLFLEFLWCRNFIVHQHRGLKSQPDSSSPIKTQYRAHKIMILSDNFVPHSKIFHCRLYLIGYSTVWSCIHTRDCIITYRYSVKTEQMIIPCNLLRDRRQRQITK